MPNTFSLRDYALYSDHELTELLVSNDENAFTEIYNRYWDKLFGLGVLKLHSVPGAEDIVQEVFSDLWNRRNEVKIQHLSAYLGAAVKYSVIKRIARLQKENIVISEWQSPSEIAEYNSAEQRFLERLMETEINRLPEKCRIVFQYSRQEQLSNKEIADKMNLSLKSVEKHITSALRKLRMSIRHTFSHLF